jgi:hypothetical protein
MLSKVGNSHHGVGVQIDANSRQVEARENIASQVDRNVNVDVHRDQGTMVRAIARVAVGNRVPAIVATTAALRLARLAVRSRGPTPAAAAPSVAVLAPAATVPSISTSPAVPALSVAVSDLAFTAVAIAVAVSMSFMADAGVVAVPIVRSGCGHLTSPVMRPAGTFYLFRQRPRIRLRPVGCASEPLCCRPIGLRRAGKPMEIYFVMLIIVAIVFTTIGLLIGYFLWHE